MTFEKLLGKLVSETITTVEEYDRVGVSVSLRGDAVHYDLQYGLYLQLHAILIGLRLRVKFERDKQWRR